MHCLTSLAYSKQPPQAIFSVVFSLHVCLRIAAGIFLWSLEEKFCFVGVGLNYEAFKKLHNPDLCEDWQVICYSPEEYIPSVPHFQHEILFNIYHENGPAMRGLFLLWAGQGLGNVHVTFLTQVAPC